MSKKAPAPVERSDWLLPGCAVVLLFWATFLLNDVPELRVSSPDGRWPPSLIARLFTVPVPMTGTSDLRWYALPVCLTGGLVLVAIRGRWDGARGGGLRGEPPSGGWLRDAWFEVLAGAVAASGAISATVNGTWSVSAGWLFWFVSGAGWAALVGRIVQGRSISRLVIGAGIVAGTASVLTIVNRIALGEPFMDMPVGATTVTGSLGALWAASCAALLLGRVVVAEARPAIGVRPAAACVLVFALSLGLLMAAARRGAWIGLAAGLMFSAGVIIKSRAGIHRRRLAAIAVGMAAVVVVGALIQQGFISPRLNFARSLGLRAQYWKHIISEMKHGALAGHGPDMFGYAMTDAMALRRAEEPRLTHGRADYDAHNEWLQAAFELGVPGALAYLGLPLAAIILAARRMRRRPADPESLIALSLAAGLVTVVVTESASVNLRHPIMPAWYWTLLGVLAALVRGGGADEEKSATISARLPVGVRGLFAVAAAGIAVVVIRDVRSGLAHEAGRMALSTDRTAAEAKLIQASDRLGARNWIWLRTDLGEFYSDALRDRRATATQEADRGRATNGAKAVETWRQVVARCRAYRDAEYRLAEALFLSGDREGSLASVQAYLEEVNPYDRAGNLLRVHMGGLSPIENVLAIRRALRSSPIDSVLVSYALREFAGPEVEAQWSELVAAAMRDGATPTEMPWQDGLSPETLRLESVRLATQTRIPEAAATAATAARLYDALAAAESPYRRAGVVEADAWYLAARMRFDSRPADYEAAYRMILRAEEAAVLQVAAAPGMSAAELDLDPVRLRNRTPELRQLLRFSALMHLANGAELREAARRANWSLAGNRHSQVQVDLEVSVMAAELVDVFLRLPEGSRPPGTRRLFELAQRARRGPGE
ncbi:MAG: hypothetical protein DCC65_02615 [Planctomycetota bacterium]|nr:MAG: hypothetical protein DCC65_02615 [Planctomycetota bacterium]